MREDGSFCKVVNGTVVLTGEPSPLVFTPDGWLDIEINRRRNLSYFGLERSFTVPLDFVKDGGFILKHFFYNKGVEEKLFLLIAEKRLHIETGGYILTQGGFFPVGSEDGTQYLELENTGGFYFYYTAIYKGEIDFSQFVHARPKVTLNIMEGGSSKLFKAHENTVFEIPIPTDDYVLVNMDGVYLREKKNFIVTHQNMLSGGIFGIFNTTQEGKAPGVASFDVSQQPEIGDLTTSTHYFLEFTQDVRDVRLQWSAPVSSSDTGTIELRTNTGRIIAIASIVAGEQTYNIDSTFDAASGEKFFLLQGGSFFFSVEESNLSIEYRARHAQSYVPAMRSLSLFKRLAAKMGITVAESAFLKKYEDIVITCGDALRGLPNPVIKTSMRSFFKSINAWGCVGLSIENDVLKLESKQSYINTSNPIPLGECKDLKVSILKDLVFNTVKIGYPVQDYEDVNGKYEFNNSHIYTTPNTRIIKELDLMSDYRSDALGAEYVRINFEGKTTTDSSSDNDVFFLHVKDKPATGVFVVFEYYDLDRSLNPYATGILEPETIFNLWLSPKQSLIRHGAYLRSCFYQQDDQALTFQTTEKNAGLVVAAPNAAVISESGNYEISLFDAPIFRPILFEFTNKNPLDAMELLKADNKRAYSFTADGVEYIGIPIADGINAGNKEAGTFQLLSAPSNNLLNLIEYDG
jgi:hypothetical protein